MIYSELYGFQLDNIDKAKEIVEELLSITLKSRDSEFVGNYYKYSNERGEEIYIKENRESFEEGDVNYREPDFKSFPILIYIDESNEENIEKYGSALILDSNIRFLKREIFNN